MQFAPYTIISLPLPIEARERTRSAAHPPGVRCAHPGKGQTLDMVAIGSIGRHAQARHQLEKWC